MTIRADYEPHRLSIDVLKALQITPGYQLGRDLSIRLRDYDDRILTAQGILELDQDLRYRLNELHPNFGIGTNTTLPTMTKPKEDKAAKTTYRIGQRIKSGDHFSPSISSKSYATLKDAQTAAESDAKVSMRAIAVYKEVLVVTPSVEITVDKLD